MQPAGKHVKVYRAAAAAAAGVFPRTERLAIAPLLACFYNVLARLRVQQPRWSVPLRCPSWHRAAHRSAAVPRFSKVF